MVFLTKADGYQKLCDTHKNVIKMGVIVKGVYCISFLSTPKTFKSENILPFFKLRQSFSKLCKVAATPFCDDATNLLCYFSSASTSPSILFHNALSKVFFPTFFFFQCFITL
jgi:hypothetical protein